jgi:hypothetical protein
LGYIDVEPGTHADADDDSDRLSGIEAGDILGLGRKAEGRQPAEDGK